MKFIRTCSPLTLRRRNDMFKLNDPTPDHLSMKSLENHHWPETPSEKVKNRFIGGDTFVRLPRFSEGGWGLYGPSFKYQSTIFNRTRILYTFWLLRLRKLCEGLDGRFCLHNIQLFIIAESECDSDDDVGLIFFGRLHFVPLISPKCQLINHVRMVDDWKNWRLSGFLKQIWSRVDLSICHWH